MAKKDNIEEGDTKDENLQKQEEIKVDGLDSTTTQGQTDEQKNQVGGESNEEFNERIKTHLAELPKTQEEQVSGDTAKDETKKNETQEAINKKKNLIVDRLLELQAKQNHGSEEQKGESEEKDPQNTQTSKVEKKPHFIDAYKKAYPKEKLFYVTSDKQVFLVKDKHLAKFHQKGLKGGEVETIEVK